MPPTNDRISGALAITVDGSQTVDLSTATGMESDEAWWWGSPAYSLWYVWAPTVDSYLYLATDWATSGIYAWSNLVAPDDNLTTLQGTTVDGGPLHHLDATYPESGAETQSHRVDGLAGHTYLIYVAEWTNTPPASEPVTVSWTVKAKNPGPWQSSGGATGTRTGSGPGWQWLNGSWSTTPAQAWSLAKEAVAPVPNDPLQSNTYPSDERSGVEWSQAALNNTSAGVTPDYTGTYSHNIADTAPWDAYSATVRFSYADVSFASDATILAGVTPSGVDTSRPWEWDESVPLTLVSAAIRASAWHSTGFTGQSADLRIVSTYRGAGTLDPATYRGSFFLDNGSLAYDNADGSPATVNLNGSYLPDWLSVADFNALTSLGDIVSLDTTTWLPIAVGDFVTAADGSRHAVVVWAPAGYREPTSAELTALTTATSGGWSEGINLATLEVSVVYDLPQWRYLDAPALPAQPPDFDESAYQLHTRPGVWLHPRIHRPAGA